MDEDVNARLRTVINRLARALNGSASVEGLTPSQASALGLIVVRGPLSVGELTAIEGLNPTMVSRLVTKLSTSGYITRSPSPNDQRGVVLAPTPLGVSTHDRVRARRAGTVAAGLDALDDGDRAAIAAALPALEALVAVLRSGEQA